MSDLTQDLRRWAQQEAIPPGSLKEAADVIERLRGLLRDIDAIGVEFGPKIQSRIDAELAADRDGAAQ